VGGFSASIYQKQGGTNAYLEALEENGRAVQGLADILTERITLVYRKYAAAEGIGGRGADKLLASLEPDGAIGKALQDLDLGVDIEVDTRTFQVELSRSVNDFKGAPDGSLHLQRLTDITGRGATDTDLLNRQELTRSLEEALGAAETGRTEIGFRGHDVVIPARDQRGSGSGLE
jgi:hypothetical protein